MRMMFLCTIVLAFVSLALRVGDTNIYPCYISLLILFAVRFVSGGSIRKGFAVKRSSAVLVISLLPLFLSVFSADPFAAAQASVVYLYFGAISFASADLIAAGIIDLSRICAYFRISFAMLFITGLAQMLTGRPIGLIARYLGENISEESTFSGSFRVSATMVSPNVFALVITTLLFIQMAYSAQHSIRRRSLLRGTLLYLMTLLLVLSSGSRAGTMFFLCLSIISYFGWIRSTRPGQSGWWIVLMVVLCIAVVVAFQPGIVSDKIPLFDRVLSYSSESRGEMYSAAVQLIGDPRIFIFGAGAGRFWSALYEHGIFTHYRSWVDQRLLTSSVHNWILQIWSEQGIFVLLAWFAFLGAVARGYFRGRRLGDAVSSVMALCVLILFAIPLQFDTSISNPSMLTLIAVCAACARTVATTPTVRRRL